MKEITVALEDEVYDRAIARASALRISVTAMIREFLGGPASAEPERDRMKALETETISRIRDRGVAFSASRRVSRDEIHDRNALR
ncbi:MAG TPA: hypothetical protein PLA50_01630 [Bacteroidia bacterium]|nr:hypothetical protein [Bacteroidia bacterium]